MVSFRAISAPEEDDPTACELAGSAAGPLNPSTGCYPDLRKPSGVRRGALRNGGPRSSGRLLQNSRSHRVHKQEDCKRSHSTYKGYHSNADTSDAGDDVDACAGGPVLSVLRRDFAWL